MAENFKKKLTRAEIKALAKKRSAGKASGQFSNPLPAIGQRLKGLALPQHTARQAAAAAGGPPAFIPPQQQFGIERDKRNAAVSDFVQASGNSPWHKNVELKEAGMLGGAPLAPSAQGVPEEQAQEAIGAAGDLKMSQGQVVPPANQSVDYAGGQFQGSIDPSGQVTATSPQGTASYDMAPGGPGGPGAPVSSYAQELRGPSKAGISQDVMAQANKNMREGRSGQGTFGISAPGAMGAMAGAGGYAGSTPEGENNVGNTAGAVGSPANTGGAVVAGAGGVGENEGLAQQQNRIETMRQWQSIDPSERGKMPQRVRDAFGLGAEPEQKASAPQKTQEWQRELEMRNAGVGADTAHGKNSPWYNPESVAAAGARQAAVGAKYAAEDERIAGFEEGRAERNVDNKRIETTAGIADADRAGIERQKELDRQASERIANIQAGPKERYQTEMVKQYDKYGAVTGEKPYTYSGITGLPPEGQTGIDGPQFAETEEGDIAYLMSKNVEKGSKKWNDYLKRKAEERAGK